jgi:hypothetical protein
VTTPAPVIQRLKTHQANARRMLTPGLKNPAGQQRSFSPVLDGFGGQKYTQIVQKMRFLNNERLGALSPEKTNLIGRELPARFSNPAGLLHVKPPSTPDGSSIWSSVEQVLPAAGTAGRQESAPEQPGTLRQGSVIQRIQNFPKPGQDIESFKKEVQSRALKPAAPVRKPPEPGDPSVRRYSRIEEITARETPPSAEPPADVQRQPEPVNEKPRGMAIRPPDQPAPVSEPPAPPLEARPPDQPAPVSEPPAPPLEARPPDQPAPVSEPPAPPLEARPSDQPVPASEPPIPPLELRSSVPPAPASEPTPPAPEARTSGQPPAQPTKVRPAPPPLPRALPAPKKASPLSERVLPKAKPTSRPETRQPVKPQAAPAPHAGLKSAPVPVPTSRPTAARPAQAVIQRQPDQPAPTRPADEPVSPPVDSVAPDLKQQQESEQTDQPLPLLPQETPIARLAPRQPEGPLQAHLAGRRKAPEQVRFIAPRMFKTETKVPVTPPVLSRQKARTAPRAASKPALKSLDLPPAPLPALSRQEAPAPPQASPAIEMPVARLSERAPAFAQPGGAQVLSAIQQSASPQALPQPTALAEPSQQQRAEVARPATRSAAGNVVQRLWDEHSPPSSATSSPSSGTSGDQDSDGQPDFDLDKLAEDVFPIVKRLIEIESERSSGYLR